MRALRSPRVSLLLLIIGMFWLGLLAPPASASVWSKNLTMYNYSAGSQVAVTSIPPARVDTTETVNLSGCADLSLKIFCDADSSSVTVQGANSTSNWVTLETIQINGTDETYALQYDKIMSALGSGGTTYLAQRPTVYYRLIWNNNDAVGADTVETLGIRLSCNK